MGFNTLSFRQPIRPDSYPFSHYLSTGRLPKFFQSPSGHPNFCLLTQSKMLDEPNPSDLFAWAHPMESSLLWWPFYFRLTALFVVEHAISRHGPQWLHAFTPPSPKHTKRSRTSTRKLKRIEPSARHKSKESPKSVSQPMDLRRVRVIP